MEKRFLIYNKEDFHLVTFIELRNFFYINVLTNESDTNFTVVDLNKLDELTFKDIIKITSYCQFDPTQIAGLYYIGKYDIIKDLIVKYMTK